MKLSPQNGSGDPLRNAEETLRLVAAVHAPEGLVERVQAGLRAAPRTSRLLHWPLALSPGMWIYSGALRGAAAAAIVCVVAGGGWRIYSHVQPASSAKVIVMPARVGASGGFSSAGAMRTPETLNGPVLTHAIAPTAQNPVSPASKTPPRSKKHARATASKPKTKTAPQQAAPQ
ncbi:MAG TPA: hypothetical protein VG267_12775 [Terracidiphilus sp.]|jgi:hypothetical protein|nr:hypothetical protein [Terracidiphilus sp.]